MGTIITVEDIEKCRKESPGGICVSALGAAEQRYTQTLGQNEATIIAYSPWIVYRRR